MTTDARYTPELEARVSAWVETQVDPDRYEHTRGVVEAATRLAARYAPDQVPRVRLAAWIHDVAKGWDDDRLLAYAGSHQWPLSPTERAVPLLLHGVVGYFLAAEQFGLDDPLLQSACALHTTGAPGMTAADKIVFVADLIEPTRSEHRVGAVRQAIEHDLDAGVLCAVDTVLKHLIRRQRLIDPRAFELRNQLLAAGVRYPNE